MKQNRFDWFLLLVFLANMVLCTIDKNIVATLGWSCAFLILIRILASSNIEKE